eukprot:13511787-Alexandrium_andersonii.AAC.1
MAYSLTARVQILYSKFDALADWLTEDTWLLQACPKEARPDTNLQIIEHGCMKMWSACPGDVDASVCAAKTID